MTPSPAPHPDATIRTSRVFDARPGEVFAAFEQPERLAQWWGPDGFTNTFEVFEFQPGGRWTFVMHGPNGADFHNENIFHEIQRPNRIVLEHILPPWFRLTITLTPRGDQTHLAWDSEFESPEMAAKLRPRCEPANEQVLNRLAAVLARGG